MDYNHILRTTEYYVQNELAGDSSGHEWGHIQRVRGLALRIHNAEGGDRQIVELASLLHDIRDWKLNGGDILAGPRVATEFLSGLEVQETMVSHVADIITNLSYKGACVANTITTLEGKIVQDADRLDAMGAIGIARLFMYAGHRGICMHNPEVQPVMHETAEDYCREKWTGISHFYEKLLLLKDRMNTNTGRVIATERHTFVANYLQQFLKEWDYAMPQR